jgi:hypothetical protein
VQVFDMSNGHNVRLLESEQSGEELQLAVLSTRGDQVAAAGAAVSHCHRPGLCSA